MIFFEKTTKIKAFLLQAKLSERTCRYLLSLVAGFLCHWGRMTASQAGQAIVTAARHRGNIGRFLAESGESVNWLESPRTALLRLEPESRRGGTWLFLLDQTQCSQQGSKTENTYSTGNRQRRPRKGRRYSPRKLARKTVHAFVLGLLITPSGLRLPFSRCYYTKDYCLQKNLVYRTQSELGAELIAELQVPPNARVIVLGDTAYDAKVIRAACAKRNYTWIVPVNPERVLAGPKPRPKIRAMVLGMKPDQFVPVRLHPNKGRFVAQRRLSKHRIGPKVKSRTFYVHAETREVHSVGMAQLVFSCKEIPSQDKPIPLSKILMTNDTKLTAAEVVELYSLRWQIELFIKEIKGTLGMHQYRFRKFEKVAAWVQAALLAFLFLEWTRARKLRARRLSPEEKRRWQSQRTHGLCRAIRHEAEAKELEELARLAKTKTGLKKLRKLLYAAQPPEYRASPKKRG